MWRFIFSLALALAACAPIPPQTASTPLPDAQPVLDPGLPVTAIVHGTIISGLDAPSIPDGLILIQDGRIRYVGEHGVYPFPENTTVIDASGVAVLPGFINTHIHHGYSNEMLQKWVRGGVTTVRDEGTSPGAALSNVLALRDDLWNDPQVARLVSAGAMMGAPGGYGNLFVSTMDEAIVAVNDELDRGADQIKVSLEDGYAGKHDLPKLSGEQLTAIVETAHTRGVRVSGHITQAAYIPPMLDAGVDDIAHLAWDPIPAETIQRMVEDGVYLIPTFTVFRNYGAAEEPLVANLKAYVEAGGKVALGNDYGGGPGTFEVGIPIYEIKMMAEADMTPMQIIQAGTRNAAVVIGLEDEVGTLEVGKIADVILVDGDPLKDISVLAKIRSVIHLGVEVTPSAEE